MRGFAAVFTTCMAMAVSPCIVSAEDWKFLYESDGLSVYKSKDPETRLCRYKAEGIYDINFFEMVAVLTDVPRRVEWVTNLSEVELIEGDSAIQGIVYNVFDLPWPACDREMIIHAVGKTCPIETSLTIEFESVEKKAMPVGSGRIRIPYSWGRNYLKYLDPTHTEVCFEVQVDPGGIIPKWIANIFIKDSPIKTLKVMKQQAIRTRGEYKDLSIVADLVKPGTEI